MAIRQNEPTASTTAHKAVKLYNSTDDIVITIDSDCLRLPTMSIRVSHCDCLAEVWLPDWHQ